MTADARDTVKYDVSRDETFERGEEDIRLSVSPDEVERYNEAARIETSRKRDQRFIWALLAFAVPAIIHAIGFTVVGISPFGDRSGTMMVIDNFHQYSPFLLEFRDILKEGGSLLYSWGDGLGTNYWARYAYYLASPLNFLFVLFPARLLPEFIVFLTLTRTGLSGLCFYFFAREKFGVDAVGARGIAFAAMYAVSSHTLAYYWNIMWFDCIWLLPLVALGIDRLVRGSDTHMCSARKRDASMCGTHRRGARRRGTRRRGGVLYCVALGAAMYTNYYIALIVCIFSALYFVISYIAEIGGSFRQFIRRAAVFAGYSLLAAGLAAVILLPTWSALSVSQSAGAKFPDRVSFYYSAFEILQGHLFNVKPSVMSGMPNIYCGIAALIMLPLYFANRKFPLREKVAYGSLLAFILVSCNVNYLNFIWHGLHFPNSLPYRFTFLYIFLIAQLCCKAAANADGIPRGAVFKSLAGALAFTLVMEKLDPDLAKESVVYPTLIVLGVITAATAAMLSAAKRVRSVPSHAVSVFVIAVCVELAVNTGLGISSAGVGQRDNYMLGIDEVRDAVAEVMTRGTPGGQFGGQADAQAYTQTDTPAGGGPAGGGPAGGGPAGGGPAGGGPAGGGPTGASAGGGPTGASAGGTTDAQAASRTDFYRAEFLKDTVSNTPSIYGYQGVSYFSSTAVVKFTDLMDALGLRPSSAWFIYKGNTPIVNSVFSLRYLMSKEDTYDHPLYPPVSDKNGIRSYENPYALPLGFAVSTDIRMWGVKQPNPFTVQNDFLRLSAGSDGAGFGDVMNPVAVKLKELKNTEITENSGSLYRIRVLNTSESGFVNFTVDTPPDVMANGRRAPVYLYINSRDVDYTWYIKGNNSEGHNIKNYPYIIDTQYFGDADTMEVSLKFDENNTGGSFEIFASSFDYENFMLAYEKLSENPLILDTFKDTYLSGTVTMKESGLLFTSIPYDRGWSARIDGDGVPADGIELIGDGFLALKLSAGAHRVEFSYMPHNFLTGLTVSILSLCAIAAIVILRHAAGRRLLSLPRLRFKNSPAMPASAATTDTAETEGCMPNNPPQSP